MIRRRHVTVAAAFLLILSIILTSLSQAYASNIVDSTSTGTPLGWSNQRRVFRNPRGTQNYYAFYGESADANAGKVDYAYSTDGVSWTTRQAVFSTSAVITSASVTYIQDSGNTRLLVYVCGDLGTVALTTSNNLYFRAGHIADASSTITWDITDQTVGTGSTSLGFVACSIGVDNNKRIGIAYDRLATGITHTAAAFLSDTASPTTVAPTWNSQTGLSDTSASTSTLSVFASITPVTGDSKAIINSHQFVVVSMNTNTGNRNAIQIDWTGTTATRPTSPLSEGDSSGSDAKSCVSVSDGNLDCAYGRNSGVVSRRVTIPSGTVSVPSFGSSVTISSDVPESNVGVSLSYEGGGFDTLFAFWATGGNVNVKVAFSAASSLSWSSATTIETEGTNAHGPRGAPEAFGTSEIPYALYDSAGTPNVRWDKLIPSIETIIVASPVTSTITTSFPVVLTSTTTVTQGSASTVVTTTTTTTIPASTTTTTTIHATTTTTTTIPASTTTTSTIPASTTTTDTLAASTTTTDTLAASTTTTDTLAASTTTTATIPASTTTTSTVPASTTTTTTVPATTTTTQTVGATSTVTVTPTQTATGTSTVTVTPTSTANTVIVTVTSTVSNIASASVTVTGTVVLPPPGPPKITTDKATYHPGDLVHWQATGYPANTNIVAALQFIGNTEVQTDANGSASGTFVIPIWLPAGQYMLQVYVNGNPQITAQLTITVTSP